MNRREVLRLLGVGAAAALGSACQVPAPRGSEATPGVLELTATPQPTATPVPTAVVGVSPGIRLAIDIDPDTLEPAGQTHPTTQSIVDYMAETLVRLQPDGTIAPGLARRWQVTPDGRTYTFELRPDVRFHDGSLLTSEAVKQTFERFLNQELRVPLRAPFDIVMAIVPLDPLSFRIYLKDTARLFLHKLASTEMAIVSPGHAGAFPTSFNEEPIGSGPYRFKERRKGESVLLERFDAYWGQRPHYPHVQFRIVPEVATRESLLLANQVEVILQPPLSDVPALQRNSNLRVVQTPTGRSTFVGMDLTLPGGTPLSIKKVRQALNYAIDRESVIRNVLFGAATPMDAPMAPVVQGYARIGGYSYDPGRARQLLLEGGTPTLALRLLHPTGRSMQEAQAAQVAQALAGNLREVGVELDLVGSDWPSFLAAISVGEDRGTAHLHLFNWMPALLDASQQMTQFVRPNWPPQGLATSHYSNPRVEQLVEQASGEREDQRRNDLYAEAQRIVWDDAPWLFLWNPSFLVVHAAQLQAISGLPSEKLSAIYAAPI